MAQSADRARPEPKAAGRRAAGACLVLYGDSHVLLAGGHTVAPAALSTLPAAEALR